MKYVTRLAPSPTGYIHLGNAWAFMLCWLMARQQNGQVILRIDDIDPVRSRQEFILAIKKDLAWLGLDWDREYYQSERSHIYQKALDHLEQAGLIYPCFCSRKDLHSLASAPHPGDEGAPYPGTCRELPAEQRAALIQKGRAHAQRLKCPDYKIKFRDIISGEQTWRKNDFGGDFALKRSDGVWAYQFASAIDDGEMGVNLVLRGSDLLPSTPRQIILADLLGFPRPEYAHIGLLLDHEGQRLAKRHRDLSLSELRDQGVQPAKIIGFLAYQAGFNPANSPLSLRALLDKFAACKLPAKNILLPENVGALL